MNTYKILTETLGAVAISILFSTHAIAQEQAAKDMKILNKEIKMFLKSNCRVCFKKRRP